MNIKVSRFLSVFMAVLLLVVLCLPAFASVDSDPAPTDSRGNFYDWLVNQGGSFAGDRVSGGGGRPSKDGYDNFVSELPATGYTSDGSLLYSPAHDYSYIISNYVSCYCVHHDDGLEEGSLSKLSFRFDCASNSVFVIPRSGSASFGTASVRYFYKFVAPIDGFYTRLSTSSVSGYYIDEDGLKHFLNKSWSSGSSTFYSAGGEHSDVVDNSFTGKIISVQGLAPIYKITPVSALSGDTYNINTRPTSITGGNYGIVGDNGTINTVTNNTQIVNETNNTYFNPATGTTLPILDWTYDYGDRIYSLNLEGGVSVNVKYCDENITITENNVVEGDTIVNNYTIYYIVEGSGADHTHDWVQTGAVQGNCLTPAQRTYTCTVCNEQYTETDPAPGHSWRAIRTVPTTYDEDGDLTQEGYTIYECERCNEQYKSTNIDGPPSSGGGGSGDTGDDGESIWDKIGNFFGTIFGGLISMIGAVLSKILDGLIALAEMLMEKLTAVVEVVLTVFDEVPKLFGGFLDFLGVVFPYIPPEITLLLTFGIIAVVFIGIIKALRR